MGFEHQRAGIFLPLSVSEESHVGGLSRSLGTLISILAHRERVQRGQDPKGKPLHPHTDRAALITDIDIELTYASTRLAIGRVADESPHGRGTGAVHLNLVQGKRQGQSRRRPSHRGRGSGR